MSPEDELMTVASNNRRTGNVTRVQLVCAKKHNMHLLENGRRFR